MTPIPPRAERLVRWSLAPWERAAVLGDLHEESKAIADARGESAARRWYWRQAIVSVWPNLVRRFKGDERRRHAFNVSMGGLSYVIYVLLRHWNDAGSSALSGWYWVWLVTVLIGTAVPFLGKRLRPARVAARWRAAQWVAGAVVLATMLAAVGSGSAWAIALAVLLFVLTPLPFRGRGIVEPAAYIVGYGGLDNPDRDRYLTWRVPNEPAGLGGFAICQTAVASNLPGPPVGAVTIRRRFPANASIRLCGAINLTSDFTRATLDIVDRAGQIVRTMPLRVDVGKLIEVPESWDDLADREAMTHFGEIDVLLGLSGLQPGRYTLRLTTLAGDRGSRTEDEIEVTA